MTKGIKVNEKYPIDEIVRKFVICKVSAILSNGRWVKCVVFTEKRTKVKKSFYVIPCVFNTMGLGRNKNGALIELADFFSGMLIFRCECPYYDP